MTLNDALSFAEYSGDPRSIANIDALFAAEILAAEVRRLQTENASLRLYSPDQRAQPTVKTEPVGLPNFAFFGVETDEEFAAKGLEYTEVTE